MELAEQDYVWPRCMGPIRSSEVGISYTESKERIWQSYGRVIVGMGIQLEVHCQGSKSGMLSPLC